MTIDNKLQFDKHVSSIYKKVNNQLNVMIRFRKLISKATLIKLRFILGDFESAYYNLLDKVNCASLYNKRIHNMLILLYKSLF